MPKSHDTSGPGALAAAGGGALVLGAAGFCAGFFGPIALNPDANQGPLVGIFITGPGGAIQVLTPSRPDRTALLR